jgi:hypothetical protein
VYFLNFDVGLITSFAAFHALRCNPRMISDDQQLEESHFGDCVIYDETVRPCQKQN